MTAYFANVSPLIVIGVFVFALAMALIGWQQGKLKLWLTGLLLSIAMIIILQFRWWQDNATTAFLGILAIPLLFTLLIRWNKRHRL